jgi:hypothetical protein
MFKWNFVEAFLKSSSHRHVVKILKLAGISLTRDGAPSVFTKVTPGAVEWKRMAMTERKEEGNRGIEREQKSIGEEDGRGQET